jgi:hypothetical protein
VLDLAEWFYKKEVEVLDVFKKMGHCIETYLIKFKIPVENSIFKDEYEFYVQQPNFFKKLVEFSEGKVERCYFAFGMQDIDIYRMKDGRYAITHSPHEGKNIQLILADGQFDEILKCDPNN